MLKPTLFTVTLLHVSGLRGSSSGSTDTFQEQNQQNICQDGNISGARGRKGECENCGVGKSHLKFEKHRILRVNIQ